MKSKRKKNRLYTRPSFQEGPPAPIFGRENFGYVSRSVASSLYLIEAYVELIKKYGFSLINLVHMDDKWESSVARVLVSHAGDGFKIQVLRFDHLSLQMM
jgi:hypothetical protein